MTNPYFDITHPQNNREPYYSNQDPSFAEEMALNKRLDAHEVYRVIPFLFEAEGEDYDQNIKSTLKDLLVDFLKNNNNLPSLGVRAVYPEDFKRRGVFNFPENRDNLLHYLVKISSYDISAPDIELIKDIFTKTLAKGISPLEKSMQTGYTPLAIFLSSNFYPKECQSDFLKFLIDLHPESLTDFSCDQGMNPRPIISLVLDTLQRVLQSHKAPQYASLLRTVGENLPLNAFLSNYDYLQNFYNTSSNERLKTELQSVADTFQIRYEKIQLDKTMGSVLVDKNINHAKNALKI